MKLLSVDTLDKAREKILERVTVWPLQSEIVSLDNAQDRILAEDLYSPCDIPGFDRSTVDGYALKATDTAAAGEAIPVFLKLKGNVSMGECTPLSINCGECVYVPTGGMLPQGADAVVMIEHCESASDGIAVYESVAVGAGVALSTEDVKKGALLLKRGTLIRPQEIGALAASGIMSLSVFSPFNLGIISTGDELIPPEQEPRPGEIRDINSYALKAQVQKRAFTVTGTQLLSDNEEGLEAALKEALAENDIVIISGGSSQGEKDITAKLIDKVARPGVFTQGLALKPGKPTILGWDEESQALLAGLPGHPVAAMMVFELLLGWLHDKLFKLNPPFQIPARISCNVPGAPGRAVCQGVILHKEEGGYSAEPVFGKSATITTLTQADGYFIIDLNKEGLKKGESVMVQLF